MFWAWNFLVLNSGFNEQSVVILLVNWFKNECFWKRFPCTNTLLLSGSKVFFSTHHSTVQAHTFGSFPGAFFLMLKPFLHIYNMNDSEIWRVSSSFIFLGPKTPHSTVQAHTFGSFAGAFFLMLTWTGHLTSKTSLAERRTMTRTQKYCPNIIKSFSIKDHKINSFHWK